MKVGDLIRHKVGDVGIIIHIFTNGHVDVLFEDGEYHVPAADCEVINDSR